jgi:hypothetical protein
MMSIQAIASQKHIDIRAAAIQGALLSIRANANRADIDPTKPISQHELNAKLRASALKPEQRIQIKIVLERGGMILD